MSEGPGNDAVRYLMLYLFSWVFSRGEQSPSFSGKPSMTSPKRLRTRITMDGCEIRLALAALSRPLHTFMQGVPIGRLAEDTLMVP